MEAEELCRKLKPVIGEKAERLWLAYLAEDSRGKRDLEVVLGMLAARHLGSNLEERRVHLSVPAAAVAGGEYPIGSVVYNDKDLHSFGIRESEWIQHTAIFGRSGAGKTNTVFVLIENLLNKHKPFLVFDWKRNYRDLLSVRDDEVLVYTVGREAVPFAFNPLIPPEGTDPSTWLKKLNEIICHAYYLGEGVMFLLQEALHEVYQDFGVYTGAPEEYPTFNDVLEWLEKHPARGRKALWMDSALRGVKSICFGHMGEVVNTAVQPNIAALLDKNVILELDSLTNADKTLIIESLLLWIHHFRLCQPERETFKHAMIIEEAHHILLRRTGAGSGGEAITDTILREIRELGEAIVLVDQHPSLISIPAMGNTYTTIALNVKHASDVNALGGAMLLGDEEKDFIGRLPIGQAMVKLQGRWLEPFLIRIPHRKIQKGAIDDTLLVQHMAARNVLKVYDGFQSRAIDSQRNEETGNSAKDAESLSTVELSDKEQHFLTDILEHPLAGAVERYHNLQLSRRKGNAIREACVTKGLLALVDIKTNSGKCVLTELTEHGKNALRSLGVSVPDKSRWGSLEHEYWKHKVAEKLTREGWTVTLEEPVNGYADIIAEKKGRRVAIEIETGKSNWRANLTKNLNKGFKEILIITTNTETQQRITTELENTPTDAQIWTEQAQKFSE